MKACTRCGEVKPLTDYYRKSTAKDGLTSSCKACEVARSSEWNRLNLERCNVAVRAYRDRNIENIRAWDRAQSNSSMQTLGERYIKSLLQQSGFVTKGISAEIVELKRQQIETLRLARQLKKAANESSKDPR